ncbi:CTR copper uptake transporter, partial [Multifurca ochricompacta]
AFLSLLLFRTTLAHENGMDMNMDHGMSMNMGNVIMYLHFTPGDNLWFLGWAPRSVGSMVGTCIGLFMLAIAERWLATMRSIMEESWSTLAEIASTNNINASIVATSPEKCPNPSPKVEQPSRNPLRRRVPPFILSHDVPRGIMELAIASIKILFMLSFMTFQLGFIFAIILGLGVGEALFGRY